MSPFSCRGKNWNLSLTRWAFPHSADDGLLVLELVVYGDNRRLVPHPLASNLSLHTSQMQTQSPQKCVCQRCTPWENPGHPSPVWMGTHVGDLQQLLLELWLHLSWGLDDGGGLIMWQVLQPEWELWQIPADRSGAEHFIVKLSLDWSYLVCFCPFN